MNKYLARAINRLYLLGICVMVAGNLVKPTLFGGVPSRQGYFLQGAVRLTGALLILVWVVLWATGRLPGPDAEQAPKKKKKKPKSRPRDEDE